LFGEHGRPAVSAAARTAVKYHTETGALPAPHGRTDPTDQEGAGWKPRDASGGKPTHRTPQRPFGGKSTGKRIRS